MANLNRIMMNFEFEKAVKYSKSRGGERNNRCQQQGDNRAAACHSMWIRGM